MTLKKNYGISFQSHVRTGLTVAVPESLDVLRDGFVFRLSVSEAPRRHDRSSSVSYGPPIFAMLSRSLTHADIPNFITPVLPSLDSTPRKPLATCASTPKTPQRRSDSDAHRVTRNEKGKQPVKQRPSPCPSTVFNLLLRNTRQQPTYPPHPEEREQERERERGSIPKQKEKSKASEP